MQLILLGQHCMATSTERSSVWIKKPAIGGNIKLRQRASGSGTGLLKLIIERPPLGESEISASFFRPQIRSLYSTNLFQP